MKKVIISLGFAAATILAANAQETPQPQDETQQAPQEQTQPEDQTNPQDKGVTPEDDQQNATMQDQDKQGQKDQDQKIKGEGIQEISDAEVPQEVKDALEDSDFKGATVEQAYLLKGAALEQILGDESTEIYAGDQTPEQLYELRVKTEDDKNALVYITNEGEVYASKKID